MDADDASAEDVPMVLQDHEDSGEDHQFDFGIPGDGDDDDEWDGVGPAPYNREDPGYLLDEGWILLTYERFEALDPRSAGYLEQARAVFRGAFNSTDPFPPADRIWEYDNWDLKKIGMDALAVWVDQSLKYGSRPQNESDLNNLKYKVGRSFNSLDYNVPEPAVRMQLGETPSHIRQRRARDAEREKYAVSKCRK